jgi:hypothetical protein
VIVYVLTKRGTLHKAEQTEAGLQSFETDNLDSAQTTVYGDLKQVPAQLFRRWCRRCFKQEGPNG